jgi:YD repeat-containing protein
MREYHDNAWSWFLAAVAWFLVTVSIVLVWNSGITRGHAGEQTRFYDDRGRPTGTATTDSQGTTVFRDDRGNVTGRASSPPRSGH